MSDRDPDTQQSEQSEQARRRRQRRRRPDATGKAAPTAGPPADAAVPPTATAETAPTTPAPTPTGSPAPDPTPAADARQQNRRGGRTGRAGRAADRTLRDIVGAGRSQVGPVGAMRARDVNRPTDEDLAEAERTVVVVHRNWRPPPG